MEGGEHREMFSLVCSSREYSILGSTSKLKSYMHKKGKGICSCSQSKQWLPLVTLQSRNEEQDSIRVTLCLSVVRDRPE